MVILAPVITSALGAPFARKHRLSGLCRLGNPNSVPWVHKHIHNATSARVADSPPGCCYTLAGPPSSVSGPTCFGHNKDYVLLLRTMATLIDERLSQLCVWARLPTYWTCGRAPPRIPKQTSSRTATVPSLRHHLEDSGHSPAGFKNTTRPRS